MDIDCPQGMICREGICGPVSGDASTSSPDSSVPVVEDASTQAPPPPTCRQLYELCTNDCCIGLNCISGTCR